MASHKIVWERSNKHGKWFLYSADICNYLEENFKKKNVSVCLGDVDEGLKIYSVNLKDFFQVSEVTGTKLPIRRRRCDSLSVLGRGFSWQWLDDHDVWNDYDADVNDFIDIAFLERKQSVSLSKKFPGYPYEIVFSKMLQINKRSKRKRKIRRADQTSSYPDETLPTEDSMDEDLTAASAPPFQAPAELDPNFLAQEIPGTEDLLSQVNAYRSNVQSSEYVDAVLSGRIDGAHAAVQNQNERNFNVEQSSSLPPTTVALVNGRPWPDHRPPHTPRSKLKPVPGIEPLPKFKKPKKKKKKGPEETCPEEKLSPLERYTEVVDLSPELSKEDCVICFGPLSDNSAYIDDKTVVKLTLCAHVFHKGCIEAMYNSGKKEFLQCPFCKTNHGEKHGIQPPGEMIYHVLPYSLPGYPENDTIRILYDIPPGIQGPEHPNPGRPYTARGFPRHCYLPDNEMGRKILRLLIKAWNRRLIFTVGRSSTTGEENTVTWNEIHHKTEFGCNRYGHGYPDPNYFYNVLAELEAHGVIDDEVRVWCPA